MLRSRAKLAPPSDIGHFDAAFGSTGSSNAAANRAAHHQAFAVGSSCLRTRRSTKLSTGARKCRDRHRGLGQASPPIRRRRAQKPPSNRRFRAVLENPRGGRLVVRLRASAFRRGCSPVRGPRSDSVTSKRPTSLALPICPSVWPNVFGKVHGQATHTSRGPACWQSAEATSSHRRTTRTHSVHRDHTDRPASTASRRFFIRVVDTAILINDSITATLLLALFTTTSLRSLLTLAAGFLFTAFLIVPHALTLPGVFAPNGLLGARLRTPAWLNEFWHLEPPGGCHRLRVIEAC
jgi:hypothetical protein